jgi:hypothetical protein
MAVPSDPTQVEVYAHGFRVGEEGIDAEAASRWRGHIHPFAARLLSVLLGGWMKRLGYGAEAREPSAAVSR